LSNPGIVLSIAKELVATSQSVVLADLIVEARADVGARPGVRHTLVEKRGIEVRVEHDRVHNRHFIDVAPLKIKEERCFFVDRASDVCVVDRRVIGRLLTDKRIA